MDIKSKLPTVRGAVETFGRESMESAEGHHQGKINQTS